MYGIIIKEQSILKFVDSVIVHILKMLLEI